MSHFDNAGDTREKQPALDPEDRAHLTAPDFTPMSLLPTLRAANAAARHAKEVMEGAAWMHRLDDDQDSREAYEETAARYELAQRQKRLQLERFLVAGEAKGFIVRGEEGFRRRALASEADSE
jgi:uncharacterized alpha-E superfamily protein